MGGGRGGGGDEVTVRKCGWKGGRPLQESSSVC